MKLYKFRKYFFFLIFSILFLFILLKIVPSSHQDKRPLFVLESECECKYNKKIYIYSRFQEYLFQVYMNNEFQYFLNDLNIKNLSCDIYNSLYRGKNQKIIAYSLYGQNKIYYENLKNLSNLIKKFYPGWIMRVYYDDTIIQGFRCEIECQKDENNNLIDVVDFCHVDKLPISLKRNKDFWSANYIHKMMWRWLPIGDSLVDIFNSRDSDSLIIQREIDSVKCWLNSNKISHIMRGIIIIDALPIVSNFPDILRNKISWAYYVAWLLLLILLGLIFLAEI